MDALKAFKKYVGTSEGTYNTLLYDPDWRLDLFYDVRVRPKPTYVFVSFVDKEGKHHNLAVENVHLDDDEVYGFLKARFPARDCRVEIVKEVKERVGKIIDKIS